MNKLFKPRLVFGLLKRGINKPDDDVNDILNIIAVKPNEKVSSLGFNERKLLAFEIACAKAKNVIINRSGLDYSGLSKIRERIIPFLKAGGTVIELNYLTSRGRDYLLEGA
ncbi:MAG: hypothetical protein ACOYXT_08250 [Bacteroidota bacterium]